MSALAIVGIVLLSIPAAAMIGAIVWLVCDEFTKADAIGLALLVASIAGSVCLGLGLS